MLVNGQDGQKVSETREQRKAQKQKKELERRVEPGVKLLRLNSRR